MRIYICIILGIMTTAPLMAQTIGPADMKEVRKEGVRIRDIYDLYAGRQACIDALKPMCQSQAYDGCTYGVESTWLSEGTVEATFKGRECAVDSICYNIYNCRGECWADCASEPGPFTPDPGLTSPILIDVDGRGYRLTSPDDGVEFDLRATGSPQRVSWTDPNRGNAFLALDRNHDGLINDGRELFGDATLQVSSQDPNGFRALTLFDMNSDSRIDMQDLVFSELRLWIDSSHDGISQPQELFTLSDFGIVTIHLDYKVVNRRDQFGQLLRYMSFVDVEDRGRRPIYDVFFTTEVQ